MADLVAIYNAAPEDYRTSDGLSGGDRILFESLKQWRRLFDTVTVVTCPSGRVRMERYLGGSEGLRIIIVPTPWWLYRCFPLLFLYKTIAGAIVMARGRWPHGAVVFGCGDIFPDTVAGWAAKVFHGSRVRWANALYFFASKPWSKDFPYRGLVPVIRGSIYWLTQRLCYRLMLSRADGIVACNEIDRQVMARDGFPAERVCAIYGGVDLAQARATPDVPEAQRKYDAVFMARFHPQKGPMVAVQAWRRVVAQRPGARLAMIGNGAEEEAVKRYLRERGLEGSVDLLGYMDGAAKWAVLKSSRVFLHMSVYETGGMAAAEGMAAGLPVIAFDHVGFDYCYPKGMLRVTPVGDADRVADALLRLLGQPEEYRRLQQEAADLVRQWDWPERSRFLHQFFLSLKEDVTP
ncbi:MAG: glycosyltransferase [Verrucomicrobia bacterium]|nr:glycosyltransferase [Verrucomicrobiota bacterium]